MTILDPCYGQWYCGVCGKSGDEHPNPNCTATITYIGKGMSLKLLLDKCEFCKGSRGGVLGNENVIEGHVICDYCHAASMDTTFFEFKQQYLDDCKSECADNMCNSCSCWKQTRAMCS